MEIIETGSESVSRRTFASLTVPKFNFAGLAAGLLFVSWCFYGMSNPNPNIIILVLVKQEFGNT